MSRIELRPHHALCTAFFIGKGYSSDFTQNMAHITEMLRSSLPDIRLTCGWDVICRGCPHSDGSCGEKAPGYDLAVLEICGLAEGEQISWQELSGLVRERIIAGGRLSQVCGDCQWHGICSQLCNK